MNTHRDLSRRTSILALLVVFCLGNASIAAEDQTVAKDKKSKDEELSEIVVTGSLIPQAKVETSTPVTVITAADIEARGFATVADALQRASFSTGGIEGPQFSGGFTQTANSLSFFGLSPSYVKYLIDGRPMSDYPALYNGTDTIGSISGIPTVLVDHVDILPGAQSSIYGSDAIAGVVNVVIKKKFDAPVVDVRYGGYTEGGGKDLRLAVADGFSVGPIDVTVGGQYEGTAPIWGYQRDLTNKYYNEGAGPQVAERDYLVFGYFGQQPSGNTYYFLDPNNCANVAGQFGGSVGVQTRPGRGQFCGTTTSGYYTIGNDVESTQGYLHASDDITDHLQLFADALVSHDQTRFDVTQGFYGTTVDTNSPAYYYYDPNLQDFMNLQHIFSPEEAGGLRNTEDKNTNNSLRATLGLKGQVGTSWNFSFDWTYTQNKLTENTFLLLTQPLEAYFNNFLGPETVDPVNGPSFSPNYANFYKPVPTSAYSSFGGILTNYSQTEENFLRGQLTNGSLFTLPGGDAGVALEVDGGDQGWFYDVDPRYLDGTAYGYTSVGSSSGHRSRYAVTGELRLPIVKMLTLTGSARYDKYNVASSDFTKTTYNLGLEFRPIEKLLFRGRYGTAFKAPTLSDEYQAKSGYFETLTDYYLCATQGYTAAKGNLDSCAQANQSYNGSTAGNTSLKPITAKVWDLGFVWSPLDRFSLTGDIIDWRIDNEVAEQQADSLLKTEADCRLGTLDINSPTCVAALSQVTRGRSTSRTRP
jgi:outer membrane receptor protein involved in Fe transport